MLIYVKEEDVLIAAQEGTGDNLLDEDIAEGYVDYFMVNVYTRDGYEMKEVDGAQIMTKKLIFDMEAEERIETIGKFFGFEINDFIVLES